MISVFADMVVREQLQNIVFKESIDLHGHARAWEIFIVANEFMYRCNIARMRALIHSVFCNMYNRNVLAFKE